MKRTIYSLIFLSALLFLASCGGNEDEQSGPGAWGGFGGFGGGGLAVSVEAVPVQRGAISEQVHTYGTIQAQDVVAITPQVSNRVVRILVDLGDDVTSGQVMAEIYNLPYRDAVEQAEAQVRQARATLERDSTQFARQNELFERDLISQSEFDEFRTTYLNSQSQYESVEASLTQSREDLYNTQVRSPVNGVVLSRSIAEGDIASNGQVMFEVANLVGYETRVFLPVQDWEDVQIGQPVSLAPSSRGSEIATGIVSRKSPQLDPATGLGEVVIALVETSSNVYQGALVQARINLQTRENAIVIPRSAMVEKVDTYIEPETGTIELDRSYSAFIVQGDSIAVRRALSLGIEQGDRIEVLDGLEEGDSLIITGHTNIEDRSRVRVAGSSPGGPQTIQSPAMGSGNSGSGGSSGPVENRNLNENASPNGGEQAGTDREPARDEPTNETSE